MNPTLLAALECALMSMVPVIELRGALPWGIAQGLPAGLCYALCVVCNMIPVPFLLLFIRKILDWMDGTRRLSPFSRWVREHAQKKRSVYEKYEVLGLFVLVAIPLPGTGAWTGSLVAALMGVRMKHAVPAIFLGVAAAGAIMLALSLGVSAVIT